MTTKRSKPERAEELENLRTRLAEAEEVLHAIRSGDVDAVMVSGKRGEQVYTLSGADRVYRSLIEAMSEGALTLSADGVIEYANQAFARLLQTPLERVIGTQLRSFVAPADQAGLARLIQAARGENSRGAVSVRAADGASVSLHLGLSPLQLEAETLICAVATDLTEEKKNEDALRRLYADLEERVEERTAELAASRLAALNIMEEALEAKNVADATNLQLKQEIVERKQSEESLRDSEERFRGLVEQSIAGIYIIQDGKFAYVNPRTAEIIGYDSADQLIGRDPLSIVAEKDRARVEQSMRERIEGRMVREAYEFTLQRKDGSLTDVGVSSAAAAHRGQPAIIGMMQDISEKVRADERIRQYIEQLKTAFISTVDVATTLSEMRDPYTAGHERRVAEIAVAIGAELGFDENHLEALRVEGNLHDVGKITIPAEILSKPGKLSPIEYQLIQGHAQASYDVLKNVKFPWPVAEVVLQHHERMDGSGYPQGLKGEAILLEARILAVADVIEAMSSHRPYRAGLGIDKSLAEIERGRGSAYDPVVANACLKLFREKGYTIPA